MRYVAMACSVLIFVPTLNAQNFEQEVGPLLVRRCLECHSGASPKGRLDLTTRVNALKGGKSGPALVPRDLVASELWARVNMGEMPPKKPLTDIEKKILQAWIEKGADWTGAPLDPFTVSSESRAGLDWWSLKPVRRPELPKVTNAAWPRNPIDYFVLARLEAQGLSPSPEADRQTLLRRLFFDLLGLPPSALMDRDEIDAFLKDPRDDAYERLVDRLLASPHHGERWARHWLDVVRFAESNGFEYDELRRNSWPYRDWVIQSFNNDLPYDDFIRRQIAGDVLPPSSPERTENVKAEDEPFPGVAATGFLVAGGYDTPGQTMGSVAMKTAARQDELEDMVGTIGQTFLGLTVQCARCHDHKFDPIRQVEYYRLTAAVAGVRQGVRPMTHRSADEEAKLAKRLTQAQIELREMDSAARKAIMAERKAPKGPPITEEAIIASLSAEERERRRQLQDEIAALTKGKSRSVYAAVPQVPAATFLLLRGDPAQKGEEVAAAGIAALGTADFGLGVNADDGQRRRKLAEWITSPDNPLFARVMVNRLWHYHFGAGIVATPSDFGFNGGRPSHPELLDWLADEFRKGGYSLKKMHKLIVNSATYRQASAFQSAKAKIDADNRLLWRRGLHRLEAEAIRDAMLAISGKLDLKMGGPGYQDFKLQMSRGAVHHYVPAATDEPSQLRLTIYRTWTRGAKNPLLDTLDCPDPSTVAPRRATTTTPLQALALLNSQFALRMAEHWSKRLELMTAQEPAGTQIERQVTLAYEQSLNRAPSPQELASARRLAENHGLRAVCRALLNCNEFMYVD